MQLRALRGKANTERARRRKQFARQIWGLEQLEDRRMLASDTLQLDFNSQLDDAGNNQGDLVFNGPRDFQVTFTDDDSAGATGGDADGVHLTNSNFGNIKVGDQNDFVIGAFNTSSGLDNYHTSGIVAQFNRGVDAVSFDDTDDDTTLKRLYAFDAAGNLIGQTAEDSQVRFSIDMNDTGGKQIHSIEFDTLPGTEGGSNDGTYFTLDNFEVSYRSADAPLPIVAGDGVSIDLYNGIGGGPAPTPATIAALTPSGTTLSPFVDFPNPGSVINVGNSFNNFFASTTTPPDQVSGLSASNFILDIDFYLRVEESMDLTPATDDIDISISVGSDDGFYLTVDNAFIGSTGDRAFSFSGFNLSFAEPGLYPVDLLFSANSVGQSGLELHWNTASTGSQLIPQSAMYVDPNVGNQQITFEELTAGAIVSDQFVDKGILFSTLGGQLQVTDAFPSDFVPVSAPYVFADPTANPTETGEVEFTFVVPGTSVPASTDLFSFYAIDAEGIGVTATAFDQTGAVLFSDTFNAGGATQDLVTIAEPGIAKVVLTLGDTTDTSAIDNITFNTPTPLLADLSASAITGSLIAQALQPLSLEYQVDNIGFATTPAGRSDVVYLSSDPQLDLGSDTPVGSLTTGDSVDVGLQETLTVSVSVPDIVPGDYFLIVNVNDDGLITEPSLSNNQVSIPVHIPASSPTINSQSPNGFTADDITRITLGLSEPVAFDGANDPASYVLTDLGPDRQLGGGDDITIPVAPAYLNGTDRIDLLPSQGATIDLNNWTEHDYSGNGGAGDWRIENGGESVKQYVNGNPTFFVSDTDFIDREFVGRIAVETTGDDDYIGIAFGFNADTTSRPDDYYLLSWKQGNQGAAEAGFKLIKMTNSAGASGVVDRLWDGENSTFGAAQLQVLARNTSNNGWADNTEYEFAIRYDSNGDIQVSIRRASDGVEFFNASVNDPDPLGPGKIGFYNYSQSLVRYSGLRQSQFLDEGTYQITAYSGDAGLANDDGVPLDGNPAVPGFEDYVGYFTIDQTPPIRQTVTPSSTGVEIEFFDAGGMDPASVETIANYTLTSTGGDGIFDNGNDLPIPIENVTFDPSTNTARLTFQDGLFDERYQLTINGVVDLAGNSIVSPDLSNFDLVTIPASVGIDLQSGSDSGVSNTDRLTNVTTPTFDVSINKAGQVEIDFDNDGVSDYLTWIANPGTLSVTAPTLIDGNYTVTATLTPPVGTSVDNNVTIEVDTMGPAVLPGAATEDAPLDRRTVMFSEAIDLSSVLPQDITMTGPSGLIPLTNGFGSGDVYTFEFDSIFAAGTYTISGSVGLRDLAGNQANQNGDALNGQPGDEPVDTFELLPDTIAPFVQSFSPTGVRRDGVDVLTVEFSEPIDPDTFDIGQVTIIGPSGPLDLSGSEIIPVSSTAGTIFWTDWISGNSTAGFTGLGTITTDSGPVSVTYNNPQGISFFQPSGGTDYWQNGGGGRNPATSPYTSDEVTNIPSGTDIIALNRAGEQSLVFSKPIANPVFSYVSLNGNGYAFDRDFDILSFGNASDGNDAGYWGSGTSFKEVVDLGDGLFEYRLLGTGEPHGTLRFKGTFDSVSWRSLSNENWNGFTVGIDAASSSILQYQITTPGLIEQDGTYVVILDQNIADVSGNPLGNDFQAAITIDTIGPRITRAVATATATDSYLDVTFDEPIDETTLGANDILFTGPPGNIDVSAPFHLGGNIYRFQFLPQTDVGTYDITIGPNVADLVGNELDQNRDGQGGQSDDVYQTSLTIELSDLVIGDLTLTPPSDIYSGQLVTVDFTTINQGGRAVSSPFSDRVQLIDSDTMTVIGTVTLPYDPAISGDLLPGSELLRTASFQLPDGLAGTGDFEIIVTTDALGSIAEANLAGDAESNNEATVTFSATLNDYPDLAPQAITGPAFIFTGTQTNVSWQTTNASTLDLQGSWTERVYLVKQNSSVQLASLNFDNESIAAGSFAVRSRQVTIPAGLEPGEWRLQVDVDTGQTVTESDETNNSALADLATVIPITLTLSAASTSVREDGNPLTLRLTRSGDISGPLTVHLDSDDLTEITVPETVTIPANQLWVEFLATPVQDATADGDRIANVTAAVLNPDGTESDSYSSDAIGLTVIDTAVPQLTLSLASGEVNEGDSLLATVSRDLSINADPMLVTLTVSSNTQLRVPISVSLDANEASTTFLIEALSDELVEIDRAYNVTAKGFGQDTKSLLVRDVNRKDLALTLDPFVSENSIYPSIGRVTRPVASENSQVVQLRSSDPGRLNVPNTVTIPSGQMYVDFPMYPVDNLVEGDSLNLTIEAMAIDPIDRVTPVPPGGTASIEVRDNDSPTLTVTLDRGLVNEDATNPAAQGTVRRNTLDNSQALVVTLLSNDTSEATVAGTVTIPAGESETTFEINAVDDFIPDGLQFVTISAIATNFNPGSAVLVVSDVDKPDLRVADVQVPTSGLTDRVIDVIYKVRNEGRQPAPAGWTDRIYLSSDPILSSNDTLVFQHQIGQSLDVDAELTVNAPIALPEMVGEYFLIVESDVNFTIDETLEDNNRGFSNLINVTAEYNVTASTQITQAVMGTPIQIEGFATIADSGLPAAGEDVIVYVTHEGDFVRKVEATTDANGEFVATFTPLPGEAGNYVIAGAHPGQSKPAAQDAFTLIGMRVIPKSTSHQIKDGQSLVQDLQIVNLSDVDLTAITFEVVGAPENLNIDVTPPSFAQLDGRDTEAFTYRIDVLNDSITIADFKIHVTTAQGPVLDVPVSVTVIPRMGRLQVPARLDEGMLRGRLTPVDVTITNDGGAETGPISVLLPNAPWLSAPSQIASLAPGQTTKLQLVLNPGTELPLGPYSGSIVLDPTNASAVSIPFTFTAASDATGGLKITVVDELTYYGEGGKNVAGASVTLTDPFTNEVIVSGTTDANGMLQVDAIPEGNYELAVTATDHHTTRSSLIIEPGMTTERTAFIKTRLVTYNWNVEPVEFEDRTRVTIESEFQTNVPIPVIVVDPGQIDLAEVENGFQQIEFTIRNEGLIQAEDLRLEFPSHPLWEITPLIDNIDVLPAKSSVKIPVIIRRISLGAAFPSDLLASNDGPCSYTATIRWILLCGPFGIPYSVPIPILNAHGSCGNRYSGGGFVGGGGTGGGGNIGPSLNNPVFNYNPPEECDCVKASLTLSVGIPIPVPEIDLGPVEAELSAEGKIEVTAETCCEEEDGGTGLKFSGTGSISGDASFTYTIGASAGYEKTVNGVTYAFELTAGIPLNLSGSIVGTGTVERDCEGNFSACGEISISVGASAAVRVALSGTATDSNGNTFGLGGHAFVKLSTGVSGSIKKCIGEDATGQICFDGFKLSGEAHVQAGPLSETIGFEQILADATCATSGQAAEALDAFFEDMLDPETLVNAYDGTEEEFKQAVGLNPAASLGEPIIVQEDGTVEQLPPSDHTIFAAAGDVCAAVRLRLEQDVVMTRTAFEATLEVNNGAASPLEDLEVFITVVDVASGEVVDDRFAISEAIAAAFLPAPGSTPEAPMWDLTADSTGVLKWTLLPTDLAAPEGPTEYTVGGLMTYKLNGEVINVPLYPAPITVYPDAALKLKYFHQRDVYSDDPFTDEIEPSVPYDLGIMVSNIGKGTANNLEIVSAQPKIIENEKGLLIDFEIVGADVNNEPQPESLTITMGNILPDETRVGRWQLTSSLQGHFVDYTASFEHLTGFGDPRTSIVKEVEIFELIHTVRDPRVGADDLYDFLTNDVADEFDLPDTVHLSDMSVHPVGAGTLGSVIQTPVLGNLHGEVSVVMPDEFGYLRIDDPGNGQYLLDRILRDDGTEVPIGTNAWLTDRTFKVDGERPVYENKLHIFDHGGSSSYQISYRLDDEVAPQLTDIFDVTPDPRDAAVETIQIQFTEAIDLATLSFDDLTLTRNGIAVPLDNTVTFADLGDGLYAIGGLSGFTSDAGVYRLAIDAANIADFAANTGLGVETETWTNGTAPVYVFDIELASSYNSPLQSFDVLFSGPIDAATFDLADLSLMFEGNVVSTNGLTIQAVSEQQFRILNFDTVVNSEGSYAVSIDASGVADSNGTAGIGTETVLFTFDQTAPQLIDLEQPTTPRKTVQLEFDVEFDEPIDVTSFTTDDLILTRNGGPNLIDQLVSIEQISDTQFVIKGTNWNQGLEGTYSLTVDGTGIADLAGNLGANALTVQWVMDFSNPLPAEDLAITPDTGQSDTDGLTNQRVLTLTGTLAETGLSVRLYDETLQQDLGYATVTGTQFTHTFTLGDGAAHRIRVRTVDAATNLADSFIDVTLDETAPLVELLNVGPNPRDTPVSSIDLFSNERMNWSLLSLSDLQLTLDGGANLIDSSVAIDVISETLVRLTGLTGITDSPGVYQLSIGTGIEDLAGNMPSVTPQLSWTNLDDQIAPTSQVADGGNVLSPTFTVQWSGEDNQGGSGLAYFDIYVAIDGGTFSLWQTQTNETSATYSGEFGRTYSFYSVATDYSGNIEDVPAIPDWQVTVPAGGASIGDFVFNDANFNGIQDTNETGVANVDVQLFRVVNGNATLVDSTTTDMAGFYSFAGMSLDDQYSLSFTAPNGFGFTKLNVGSDFTDSDVDDLTGSTAPFSVINGLNDRWDAGLVALGSISGVVWNDSNEDGLRQTEEPGLAGWTVYIDANDNGMLDSGEVTRTTNSSGEYEFDNLRPGTYVIAEVVEGGFSQTFPGAAGASDTGTHADGAVLQRSYSNNASTGRTFSPGEEFVGPIAPEAAELIELTSFRADSRFNAFDGSGYSVVVIDTGIDVDHPFFGADGDGDGVADRIVYQYDFADNDADATDYSGHGSHVTSVIASENPAYLGVAPDVGIIHLKVFGDDGVGYFSYVEQALQWVIANANDYKIAAVNLSVGDGLNWTQSRGLHGIDDELATLASQNIIAVAAAGNAYGLTGIEGLAYPAADPNTVSVGAVWDSNRGGPWSFGENGTDYTSDADRIASFSQRHHEMLDVLAPGALITAANAVGGVSTMRGTSMATPFVTGAAVIAQQIAFEQLGRKLSPHEFRYLLDISGAIVVDGDDENDSVFNTGAAFRRLDMLALAEAVTVYDGSQLVDTSDPSGNDSTGELGTSAGGEFRYTIELAPGENRNNVDFGNHPLDNVAPSILDVVDITPDPRKTAVDQIDVTFDEPIDLSTFDHNDITLRRNGVVVALDSTITTSLLSGNTYRIAGLAGFTTDEGIYTIDVSSSNISDLAGNAGSNTETDQWITDRSGPTSNVHALSQTQSDKTFPVFVSGSDTVAAGAGSGIVSFEIYRKLNGAPWEFWTSVPANQAMAMYNAESDDSVGFYSIAIDAAGNRESKSPILEAGTYVPDLDLPVTQVDSVDDTTPTLNVTFSGSDEGGSLLQSFEVFVSVDDAIPQSLGVVPAGQADVNGIYTGSIDYRAMTDGNVHSYRFYTIGKDGRQNVEPAPSAPADATVELQFDAPSDLEIIDFDVQRGAQQRSFIRYLDVTFNSQDFASIIATLDDADPANDRIRLNRFDNDGLGPAVPVDLQGRVSSIDQVMAIDFGSGGIGGDGNSAVGNGYYRLEIDLDGDGVIATDAETLAFYRLLGDADGNRTVDYYDVSPIVQHFGATGSTDGDLNGDEITNYDDYYRIAENLGQSVDGSLDLDD